jgi:hypothetical protein
MKSLTRVAAGAGVGAAAALIAVAGGFGVVVYMDRGNAEDALAATMMGTLCFGGFATMIGLVVGGLVGGLFAAVHSLFPSQHQQELPCDDWRLLQQQVTELRKQAKIDEATIRQLRAEIERLQNGAAVEKQTEGFA